MTGRDDSPRVVQMRLPSVPRSRCRLCGVHLCDDLGSVQRRRHAAYSPPLHRNETAVRSGEQGKRDGKGSEELMDELLLPHCLRFPRQYTNGTHTKLPTFILIGDDSELAMGRSLHVIEVHVSIMFPGSHLVTLGVRLPLILLWGKLHQSASLGSSSPVGSLSSEDHDFDPTAEMLVHEYDDERTLEEEESQEGGRNFSSEIADLEKEGNMPLEELLAIYRYEASAGSSIDSSSGDLTDELPDMTLDKEEIAKDLLSGDYEEETQSSADDLTPSVTSHEATDFFPRTLRSNAISDGDKESECDEDGPSPEDSRKEIMVGSQYQAEVPSGLCHYKDGEKVYEDDDELLWSPSKLPENKVRTFLCDVLSRTTNEKTGCDKPWLHVRDDEQALNELDKCNYNIREALERHCLRVPTRTVAECVAFYYMWKKSERFDFFVQQNRFGKKKYSSYPGVTDLMDRLVDEAEGLAVDSSSSVCSGAGGGGRLETTTDQQLSLLNSITASDLTGVMESDRCSNVLIVGAPVALLTTAETQADIVLHVESEHESQSAQTRRL
ncbi:Mesoderm induction early response protein 3 [Liparis tanakae]|uniref:Mesoderm induction early response protein 3 n=1 Tax=Liparis tanakae TaxID=230148 RepID=A0A4Z2FQ48_9TELE|nr:Mesoderm induction early response protein 3 [Liparis tanakae]